jgi:phosphoribosylaminoimidazole-succinocarboxamide synthase
MKQYPVIQTSLPLKIFKIGKVRDIYQIKDKLLMIATDRISAFDHLLPNAIPSKGIYLTQLSNFWFNLTRKIIANHLVTADVDKFPIQLEPYQELLRGRSILVKKTEPIPIECVVRGYLAGSLGKDYKHKTPGNLPKGLKEGEKLPEPIFTPSTKAEKGHDMPLSQKEMEKLVGKELTNFLREASISLYKFASAFAEKRGIIIADTKFEFGKMGDKIILIDELLTPDSSRYWPLNRYKIGLHPYSLDKQYVRDYLEKVRWDKQGAAPQLPAEVIEETSRRYKEILRKITALP